MIDFPILNCLLGVMSPNIQEDAQKNSKKKDDK